MVVLFLHCPPCWQGIGEIYFTEVSVMARKTYSEADKAVWFTICVQFTAESLGLPIKDVARMLNHYGLAEWLLSGYKSFHTQGYEYMSELIADKLHKMQEVTA
jgi:hypothetical protein